MQHVYHDVKYYLQGSHTFSSKKGLFKDMLSFSGRPRAFKVQNFTLAKFKYFQGLEKGPLEFMGFQEYEAHTWEKMDVDNSWGGGGGVGVVGDVVPD